jgi:hypothetical protein
VKRAKLSEVGRLLDQVERLQGRHNVLGLDGGQGADVLDGDVGPVLLDSLEDHPHPVAAEADLGSTKSKTGWRENRNAKRWPEVMDYGQGRVTRI